MAYKNLKRDKLLKAIDILFLQKGFDIVTISEIATLAEVPLGNVYYYFKTKKDMIKELLKIREKQIKEFLINIEKENKDPKYQLVSFIYLYYTINGQDTNNAIPELGKFILTLLLEVGRTKDPELKDLFLPIINHIFTWCSSKFIERGKSINEAESLSNKLITALIGVTVFFQSGIKLSENDSMLGYVKFILKSFDLEINDIGTVTFIANWKK